MVLQLTVYSRRATPCLSYPYYTYMLPGFFWTHHTVSGTPTLVLAFAAPCLASYCLSVLGDGPPTLWDPTISSFVKSLWHALCPPPLSMVAAGPFGPPQVLVLASLNTMGVFCLHVYNFSIVGNWFFIHLCNLFPARVPFSQLFGSVLSLLNECFIWARVPWEVY